MRQAQKRTRRKKCVSCRELFQADPRTKGKQRYCSKDECQRRRQLFSTLQGYIEAIGGKLKLTVKLPNKPPIALTGLGDLIEPSKPRKTRHY